jgi:hypothetical protein
MGFMGNGKRRIQILRRENERREDEKTRRRENEGPHL